MTGLGFEEESVGVIEHSAEHCAYARGLLRELLVLLLRDVLTIHGVVQPGIRLTVFALRAVGSLYEQEATLHEDWRTQT